MHRSYLDGKGASLVLGTAKAKAQKEESATNTTMLLGCAQAKANSVIRQDTHHIYRSPELRTPWKALIWRHVRMRSLGPWREDRTKAGQPFRTNCTSPSLSW